MPTFSKRVAPADSKNSLDSPSNRTVLFDSFDKVGTTGGSVPTVASKQRTNADLVHPNPEDHEIPWEPYQPKQGVFHGGSFLSSRTARRGIER